MDRFSRDVLRLSLLAEDSLVNRLGKGLREKCVVFLATSEVSSFVNFRKSVIALVTMSSMVESVSAVWRFVFDGMLRKP